MILNAENNERKKKCQQVSHTKQKRTLNYHYKYRAYVQEDKGNHTYNKYENERYKNDPN